MSTHYYPNDHDWAAQPANAGGAPAAGKQRHQYLDTTPDSTVERLRKQRKDDEGGSDGYLLNSDNSAFDLDNISDASGVTLMAGKAYRAPMSEQDLSDAPDEWLGTDAKLDNGWVRVLKHGDRVSSPSLSNINDAYY